MIEVVQPWTEISLEDVTRRTQAGQTVTLALKHGWVVKAAKTVTVTHDRVMKNGNVRAGKTEEHLWVGGGKLGKTFEINRFYIKRNNSQCDFVELKRFILEN